MRERDLPSTTGPDFNAAWQEAPWRDVETQLGEMMALGRERGFRVFLVAFPFGEQLRPDYLARNREYVTYPQRKLAEITGRLGIPYLDLFPVLDLAQDFDRDRIISRSGAAPWRAIVSRASWSTSDWCRSWHRRRPLEPLHSEGDVIDTIGCAISDPRADRTT
jgi:sugar phosphate isomerase/epimerase